MASQDTNALKSRLKIVPFTGEFDSKKEDTLSTVKAALSLLKQDIKDHCDMIWKNNKMIILEYLGDEMISAEKLSYTISCSLFDDNVLMKYRSVKNDNKEYKSGRYIKFISKEEMLTKDRYIHVPKDWKWNDKVEAIDKKPTVSGEDITTKQLTPPEKIGDILLSPSGRVDMSFWELDKVSPICIYCTKPSKFKCGKCKKIDYCSKQCPTNDWKEGHKSACKASV